MKAFRNIAGTVVEIDVDVDPQGQPILPPDTTVDEKPIAKEGHYVTVVGNSWVQIPIPEEVVSFEYKKQQALELLNRYRAWYYEQPTELNGVMFDANEQARGRLTQALIAYNELGYLPPFWVTADNKTVPLATIDDLRAIARKVQTTFSSRFLEVNTIRQKIFAATDEAALAAIKIPTIPSQM